MKWEEDQQEEQIPISLVEGIVIFGQIQISTAVIKACLKAKIPIFFVSKYGNYFGKLDSLELNNTDLLYNHITASIDPDHSLTYAKKIIIAKLQNSRTMLIKWSRYYEKEQESATLHDILRSIQEVKECQTKESLRGYEWSVAKKYFWSFAKYIGEPFVFSERNRRPPKDPVNSMLSLGYTLLAQTIHMMLDIQGLNTQIGFFHQPKDIRSLLVLDIMEMFRSRIVDDLVIRLTRTKKINLNHFIIDETNKERPVLLTDEWLKIFISEYYKTVFKQKTFDGEKEFIKLKMIERTLTDFKATLVQKTYNYEGFTIK